MTTKNMKQVTADLQSILDECGADDFARAKALYLKDVQIMDAEGKPVNPEDLELSIEMKTPYDADEKAVEDEEKNEEEEKNE